MLKNDQVFNPYSLIAARSEEQVIVDSTKTVYWLEKKLAAREFRQGMVEPYLLHLIRDGRAVMASYSRRKVYHGMSAQEFGQSFGEMWQARLNNEYRFYDKFAKRFGGQYPDHQRRFRYETFATQPEETAKSLCNWLGIPYERDMLDYRNNKTHVISGNDRTRASVKKYRGEKAQTTQVQAAQSQTAQTQKGAETTITATAKPKTIQEFGIKLNQQWKTILSKEQIAAFYQATDRMNERYEWT